MTRLALTAAVLAATLTLTACGKKGPLYLPRPAPDQQQQSKGN